jgi:hypothetical protein
MLHHKWTPVVKILDFVPPENSLSLISEIHNASGWNTNGGCRIFPTIFEI